MVKEEAERLRYHLNRQGLIRKDLLIRDEKDHVLMPITSLEAWRDRGDWNLELVELDTEPRSTFRDPHLEIRQAVSLPTSLKRRLPRKWERLGDVIVLRLPEELVPFRREVAKAYAEVLAAKAVLQETGVIVGQQRIPQMELLYGAETETVHPEGGILYKLDPMKVMFSSGNFHEKRRMGLLDCRGEVVVDMFAGIGYFTLPLAVKARAKKVIACEINPVAFHYLQENIVLNHVQRVVHPVLGDNRDLPGEAIADRVIMGYVGETERSLPTALRLIKPGGVVHYHDVAGVEECPDKLLRAIERACQERTYEILFMREVKTYGPCRSHMVVDFQVLS